MAQVQQAATVPSLDVLGEKGLAISIQIFLIRSNVVT